MATMLQKTRFWNKVDKNISNIFWSKSKCWEWIAYCDKDGYGHMTINNKDVLAHRFSYILKNGEIPNGMIVCHHCDNPKCVNPNHLFLGTLRDNISDMVLKKRNSAGKGIRHGTKTHPERISQGELRYNAKVTTNIVLEILNMYYNEKMLQKDIAKKFFITRENVGYIVRGNTWKPVYRKFQKEKTI